MVLACREAGSRILMPKIMEKNLQPLYPPNWNDYEQLAGLVINVQCFGRCGDYNDTNYRFTAQQRERDSQQRTESKHTLV